MRKCCDHNEMVPNNDPADRFAAYAWKCAKCGYVYGKDAMTAEDAENMAVEAADKAERRKARNYDVPDNFHADDVEFDEEGRAYIPVERRKS